MNSQASGMLIDQFARCEQTIRQASEKGITLPEEYASISLCVNIHAYYEKRFRDKTCP